MTSQINYENKRVTYKRYLDNENCEIPKSTLRRWAKKARDVNIIKSIVDSDKTEVSF